MEIAQYMDVVLRLFEESDIPRKVEWINNPDNNKYLHYDLPMRVDRTIKWFREKDNSKRVDCVIEYRGIPVGLIGLLQIDRDNFKAEYYITMGDPSFKHKGIATKATKAILDYAFKHIRLHKVYLTVDAENKPAIGLYEKTGFKQEGYYIDDIFYSGESRFVDRCRYAVMNVPPPPIKLYFVIENSSQKNITLSHHYTPIERLNYGNENAVFIKRDDLIPFSFGGNKARKADLFFKDIEQKQADFVLTYGSGSSNHCRVIANMAAARGLPCQVISPTETAIETLNLKCIRLLGAKLITCPVVEVSRTIDHEMEALTQQGYHPYFIQGGGHGNLGTQAYVNCFDEIAAYEKAQDIEFDYIFFASGTGTTQAGLMCGKIIHQSAVKIVGISIARATPRGEGVVRRSMAEYLTSRGFSEADSGEVIFNDEYTCGGYGKSNDAVLKTIKDILSRCGVSLSATYTGKAFWGMGEYIKANHIRGKNILFLHTGSIPLFFDDLEKLL